MIVRDRSNVNELIRRVTRINNTKIKIGVLGEAGSDILLRAISNEFGTTNIPERPFIRGAFDKYDADIKTFAEKLIEKYVMGTLSFEACTQSIGDYAVTKVKRYMVDLRSPPNAPSTIRIKRSSNPLIDTGQLLHSISYEVVEGV